jgi:hypothetical protein
MRKQGSGSENDFVASPCPCRSASWARHAPRQSTVAPKGRSYNPLAVHRDVYTFPQVGATPPTHASCEPQLSDSGPGGESRNGFCLRSAVGNKERPQSLQPP